MMKVVIRVDAAGELPALVSDSERLISSASVLWRWVCDVDDEEEGRVVLEALNKRRRVPASSSPALD